MWCSSTAIYLLSSEHPSGDGSLVHGSERAPRRVAVAALMDLGGRAHGVRESRERALALSPLGGADRGDARELAFEEPPDRAGEAMKTLPFAARTSVPKRAITSNPGSDARRGASP